MTAIIVAAQSTVERLVALLTYCMPKSPIITAAKTAGTIISRQPRALVAELS